MRRWICSGSGCSAEDVIERTIHKLGHLWGGLYGETQDSCTTFGNRDCTRTDCDATEKVPISVDHDFIGRIDCSKCHHRYQLGDIGPGGGRIFYMADGVDGRNPFTLYMDADDTTGVTAHYLEAASGGWYSATASNDPILYGSYFDEVPLPGSDDIYYYRVSTDYVIGTGLRNTVRILAENANSPNAKACNDYENIGKTDWFLPSRDELYQLYINQSYVDNLEEGGYYFSSSCGIDYVDMLLTQFSLDFSYGDYGLFSDYNKYVRAIRAF